MNWFEVNLFFVLNRISFHTISASVIGRLTEKQIEPKRNREREREMKCQSHFWKVRLFSGRSLLLLGRSVALKSPRLPDFFGDYNAPIISLIQIGDLLPLYHRPANAFHNTRTDQEEPTTAAAAEAFQLRRRSDARGTRRGAIKCILGLLIERSIAHKVCLQKKQLSKERIHLPRESRKYHWPRRKC